MSAPIVRDFSRIGDAVEIPNLIDVQQTSYSRFLQERYGSDTAKRSGAGVSFQGDIPHRKLRQDDAA